MAKPNNPDTSAKTAKSEKPKSAPKPRKTVAKKGAAKETVPMTNTATTDTTTTAAASSSTAQTNPHREEAKSRFSAAVQEAKAGAAALRAEAGERANAYKAQADSKRSGLKGDAQAYGAEAKVKGHELATQGKTKLSEGIATLGQMVNDNAHYVDEKVGAKYGDYARSASRSLNDTASTLDSKTVDELAADGREMVRRSPATAVGIAAVAGFMLSRLFSRS